MLAAVRRLIGVSLRLALRVGLVVAPLAMLRVLYAGVSKGVDAVPFVQAPALRAQVQKVETGAERNGHAH